jgi:hypothetical protein
MRSTAESTDEEVARVFGQVLPDFDLAASEVGDRVFGVVGDRREEGDQLAESP